MSFRTRQTMRGPGRAANAFGGRPWFQSNRHYPYIPPIPPPTHGPELITNGGFDDLTGWTTGLGWSIALGVATAALGITASALSQTVAITPGTSYRLLVDSIAGTYVGGLGVHLGATIANATISADGLQQELTLVAGVDDLLLQFNVAALNDFNGDLDNVSLKEIL